MRSLLAPFVLAGALAGCQQPLETHVDRAWVRLAAVPGRPAAGYFTLHGGPNDNTLLTVTSPLAIRSELHESMKMGPAMTMKPLAQLALPAKATVSFAPGGKHVMLFDVNPVVKPGGKVPLELTFADGLRLQYDALAVAPGAPPPQF